MVNRAFDIFHHWAVSSRGRWQFLSGLILWNVALFGVSWFVPNEGTIQARLDASGFSHDKAQHFHYFHFYTGLFPLATLRQDVIYSAEGAQHELVAHGEYLIMEYEHWSRLGENARIWAYMPHAWLVGSARRPSIRLFNLLCFVIGGIVLYMGCWYAGMRLSGTVLVCLINFTPFFWYEVHSRENIFGLQAALFMVIAGLMVQGLVRNGPLWRMFFLAGLAGLIVAFGAEIRNEIAVLLATVLALVVLSRERWWAKGLACLMAVVAFQSGRAGIRAHFNARWNATHAVVEARGGHPYKGARIPGHKLWHPVFCGLGDFGTDKGYAWNDRIAYAYAVPILNHRYGMDIKYSGALHTDNYYDADSLYYMKFDEISAYENIIMERVTGDIKNDPIWYMQILGLRMLRILTTTLPFPFAGWLVLPALWLALRRKDHPHFSLILATLPLSATPFLIYSGEGATYVSLFAYPAIAHLIVRKATSIERSPQYAPEERA